MNGILVLSELICKIGNFPKVSVEFVIYGDARSDDK
jgi:hypothetical protein